PSSSSWRSSEIRPRIRVDPPSRPGRPRCRPSSPRPGPPGWSSPPRERRPRNGRGATTRRRTREPPEPWAPSRSWRERPWSSTSSSSGWRSPPSAEAPPDPPSASTETLPPWDTAMAITAEALTLLLGALELLGVLHLPWLVVLAPVLTKYALFLGAHAAMSRARRR